MSHGAIEEIEEVTSKSGNNACSQAMASLLSSIQQQSEVASPKQVHGLHKIEDSSSVATKSSVSKANPQRPQLPVPQVQQGEKKEHIALLLIRHQIKHEKITNDEARANLHQMIENSRKLEALHQERLEALREYTRINNQKSTWDVLYNVASYVSSAFSFMIGLGCISNPTTAVAGYLLLAASGIGVANRIAQSQGWYDKLASFFTTHADTQKIYANVIENGMTALAIGAGVFTLGWGYTHGMADALGRIVSEADLWFRAIGIGGSLGQGIAAVGQGKSASDMYCAEKLLIDQQRTMMTARYEFNQLSKQVMDTAKNQEHVQSVVIQAVADLEQGQKIG